MEEEEEQLLKGTHLLDKADRNLDENERLIIKRIKLHNFKSYYGTHEIGPFHENFSSIIGPNGSGKSNLIDSLVFIFGKRASWMRLKNLRELIHNSAKFGDCDKAEVSVEFAEIRQISPSSQSTQDTKEIQIANILDDDIKIDKNENSNNSTYLEVEGSSFTVSRSISKNDESIYKINDQKVSQIDVINLLKGKGIDLDNNRFMILQGEVEQISLMKPKTGNQENPGFIEYLEDIIGTNVFIDRISELENEYQNLRAEQGEKTEYFRDIEREMTVLNKIKNEAIKFLKQEKSIYQLNNLKFQIQLHESQHEFKVINKKLNKIEASEQKESNDIKQNIEENRHLFQKINTLNQVKDRLNAENEKERRRYKDLDIQYEEKRKEIENIIADETKHHNKIEKVDAKITKLIENKSELNLEFPRNENKIKTLENQKAVYDAKISEIYFKMKDEFETYSTRLNESHSELLVLDHKKNELNRKKSAFESWTKGLHDNFSTLNVKKEIGVKEVQTKLKDIEKHNEYTLKLEQTRKFRFEYILKNEAEVSSLFANLKEHYDEEKQTKMELEQLRFNQNKSEGKNRILRQLLSAQSAGRLSGIRGRLGDLLVCPKELDIALSTAGYTSWDKIVVNTYDEATNALEYLRKEKIGKAGFLALDKIDFLKDRVRERPYQNNDAQRLFDLIKPAKDDLVTAIFWAVGQTLLCQNLEIAKRVAYGKQRFKVVTIDGVLIDILGTMSGGGEPKRGLVNSDNKNNDATVFLQKERNLNQKLKVLSQHILQHEPNYEEKKHRFESEKQDFKRIEAELEKMYRKNLDIQNDYKISQTGLSNTESDLKRIEIELKRIKNDNLEIENLLVELEVLDNKIVPLQESIFQLEKSIEDMGGDELIGLKMKLKEIEKSISEYSEKMTIKEARMKNFDNQIKKCQSELKTIRSEISYNLELKEKNKKEQDELIEIAQESLERSNKISENLECNTTELETVRSELNHFSQIIKQAKENLKILKHKKLQTEEQKKDAKTLMNKYKDSLLRVRTEYSDIISKYEFLSDLGEIEKISKELSCGAFENPSKQSEVIDDHQMILETEENIKEKPNKFEKKGKLSGTPNLREISNISWDKAFEVEVFDEYDKDYLIEMKLRKSEIETKIKVEITVKLLLKPNLDSIMTFKSKFEVYKTKKHELNRIKNKTDTVRTELENLKDQRRVNFMTGFSIISAKLKETYQQLTNGGDTELELIDFLDPFSEGILFSVRPPQKSWKQISKLSGGEKTISSLAFIYALHYYKPNPVYFMDEIDAALDYKNVSIVAKFIREKTRNAQFIVISLRSNMYEMADKLFGIYKTLDTTKSVSIEPELITKRISKLSTEQKNENDFVIE
jgi:structural maintenance of chromosome 4